MPKLSAADAAAFLYREARLLDERRYDEWLALFTEDGLYWAPTEDDAARAKRLLTPLSPTGLKPHFLEKLAANNVVLPHAFFAEDSGDVRAAFAINSYGGFE